MTTNNNDAIQLAAEQIAALNIGANEDQATGGGDSAGVDGDAAIMAPAVAARRAEQGVRVVSGIPDERADGVVGCYVAFGLIEERRTSIDGWTAAVLTGTAGG